MTGRSQRLAGLQVHAGAEGLRQRDLSFFLLFFFNRNKRVESLASLGHRQGRFLRCHLLSMKAVQFLTPQPPFALRKTPSSFLGPGASRVYPGAPAPAPAPRLRCPGWRSCEHHRESLQPPGNSVCAAVCPLLPQFLGHRQNWGDGVSATQRRGNTAQRRLRL